VSRVLNPTQHILGRTGAESLQAVDCNNQTYQEKMHTRNSTN